MTTRPALVALALVAAWSLGQAAPQAPGHAQVVVRAIVEQPRAVKGPDQVVPWSAVSGLTREDFEILVDNRPVPIDSCSAADAAVALVVLVDVSASVDLEIGRLLDPLQRHLVPALRPGDVIAFGRFGGVPLFVDRRFNAVPRAVTEAARAVFSRPKAGVGAPGDVRRDPWLDRVGLNGAFGLGGSPAWDAVWTAVDRLRPQPGRRAVILATDGRSTENVHGLNDTILHALADDVAVSVVNESEDWSIRQSETTVARVRPSAYLQPLAQSTGGGYVELYERGEQTPSRGDARAVATWLALVIARLAQDLHAGYTLTFTPPTADGAMHRLDVRTRKTGLSVRARQAFLAPSPRP